MQQSMRPQMSQDVAINLLIFVNAAEGLVFVNHCQESYLKVSLLRLWSQCWVTAFAFIPQAPGR